MRTCHRLLCNSERTYLWYDPSVIARLAMVSHSATFKRLGSLVSHLWFLCKSSNAPSVYPPNRFLYMSGTTDRCFNQNPSITHVACLFVTPCPATPWKSPLAFMSCIFPNVKHISPHPLMLASTSLFCLSCLSIAQAKLYCATDHHLGSIIRGAGLWISSISAGIVWASLLVSQARTRGRLHVI